MEQVINSVRVDCDCDIYITVPMRAALRRIGDIAFGALHKIAVYPLSFGEYLEFAMTNGDEVGMARSGTSPIFSGMAALLESMR